jgi:hypothetical protein
MLHTIEYGDGDCQYSGVWENRSLWRVKVPAQSDSTRPRSRRPTGLKLRFNLSRRPVSGRSRWKRSELLAGALGRWEQRATTEAIRGLSAVTDARQRLCLMLDAASQSPRSRSLYAALAEAAEDPIVRRALNRVASARIEYLEACYRELGLAQPLAKAKAVFACAAYRGLLQLAHEAPAVLPTDWSAYAAVVREALGLVPHAKRRPGR